MQLNTSNNLFLNRSLSATHSALLVAALLSASVIASCEGTKNNPNYVPSDSGTAACGGCPDTAKPVCDEATRKCVACLGDSDCSSARGCVKGATSDENLCAQCTRATQSTDCNGNACNNKTAQCTATAINSGIPCQACVADDECKTGYVCAPTKFTKDNTAVDVGYFCLPKKDASGAGLPNGNCQTNGQPFVADSSVSTVDGEPLPVCTLALSTCSAYNDFKKKDCGGTSSENHSMCGFEAANDAYCIRFGLGEPPAYRCTMPCSSDLDCKPGQTCSASAQGYAGTVCNL